MPTINSSFIGTNAHQVDGLHAAVSAESQKLFPLNVDAIFQIPVLIPLILAVGKTINIPADHAMLIPDTYTVNGTLNVNGSGFLWVIDKP